MATVEGNDTARRVQYLDSARAGGVYGTDIAARHVLPSINERVRVRLTTWLVDQRLQGDASPCVTEEVIEHTVARRPLPVAERAERLLRYIGEKSNSLGEHLTVSGSPLLAWTESTNILELTRLMEYLQEREWVRGARNGPDGFGVSVTVEGHIHLAERVSAVDNAQAFVAMWFDETMENVYREGIDPAIRDSGYRPLRIDQKEHINKIEDEIIAEIRRSRFVVADFTQGDGGARGGVYYEAGFAHGLGLRVILTCREDRFDKLHFDTNHYNHIAWSTPGELRDKLRIRILAVIGEGPELSRVG